jgi:hypothetical protein
LVLSSVIKRPDTVVLAVMAGVVKEAPDPMVEPLAATHIME